MELEAAVVKTKRNIQRTCEVNFISFHFSRGTSKKYVCDNPMGKEQIQLDNNLPTKKETMTCTC